MTKSIKKVISFYIYFLYYGNNVFTPIPSYVPVWLTGGGMKWMRLVN